ncbi:MAG: lysoplasmalogenase [Clostridia bacterium]|nr:lysoplasmalogenase [Clostridia bacterium]
MGLRVVSYIFLALFPVSAAIHLLRCWQGSDKSARTKPLLIASLLLYCAFAVQPPPWLLLAALFASWLGDVLLMPKGNAWFISGGISFLLSHVLFIFVYLPFIRWQNVPVWGLIAAGAVYLAAALSVMHTIRADAPKAMLVPLFLYLAANSTMNIFALSLLLGAPSYGAAAAFAGAILFFSSDSILFLSRYWKRKERIPKRGFLIMLTYIAGEALIAFGVLAVG